MKLAYVVALVIQSTGFTILYQASLEYDNVMIITSRIQTCVHAEIWCSPLCDPMNGITQTQPAPARFTAFTSTNSGSELKCVHLIVPEKIISWNCKIMAAKYSTYPLYDIMAHMESKLICNRLLCPGSRNILKPHSHIVTRCFFFNKISLGRMLYW